MEAEELAKSGVETAVLDPRWLVPLDEDSLVSFVKAVNGKILIVHEAVRTGGFASEIAMRIHELLPNARLNIHRLTTRDVRIPASPRLQVALIPQTQDIKYAVEKLLKS